MSKRVVITGIGLLTPLGADRESSWQQLCAGASGTRWLTARDLRIHQATPAETAAIADWGYAGGPAVPRPPVSEGRRNSGDAVDPVMDLALRAADEAWQDAGLQGVPLPASRLGCVLGTSKGGLQTFGQMYRQAVDGRADAFERWGDFLPNAAARAIAQRYDMRAAALCPVAACATGLISVLRGAELVRSGHCDVVLAGSSDASLQPAVLSSFRRLGVLARGFEDAAQACRPFDASRNGFVVGEGAGVLVLEDAAHARERGAAAYAEWLGGGMAADPAGLTQLDPQAEGLTRLIQDVLARARISAADLDYVNLHGTGTVANDLGETRALKAALGPAARSVGCSSLKGALGHMLGAAGSVELAATVLALRDGRIPPTINLRQADAECDLDYTPWHARPRRIEHALKLSLGFGGHLVAAVIGSAT